MQTERLREDSLLPQAIGDVPSNGVDLDEERAKFNDILDHADRALAGMRDVAAEEFLLQNRQRSAQ